MNSTTKKKSAKKKSTKKKQVAMATDITMILDRSGSMESIRGQVSSSFNSFLLEQKSVKGKATISLIQFDDQYEMNYEAVDIQDAKNLTYETYEPRGMTALNDAIGRTITSMKWRLKGSKSNVVVVITTDGMENASTEYSQAQIRDMIKECEAKLNWKFIYLAADDASFEQHDGYGMQHERSFKSGRGKRGFDNAAKVMSGKMANWRRDGIESNLDFTKEERKLSDDIGDE